MTGINGWTCQPRDCTYCSHGIHGFPCAGGAGCGNCDYGINGWRCQPKFTERICINYFPPGTSPINSTWTAVARYEVSQQNDKAWAKLYFSSNLMVEAIQLRTTNNLIAWQVYPQTADQIGVEINWGRLPAGGAYSYQSYASSTAGFDPSIGNTAPQYLIPEGQPLFLWVQPVGGTLQPAPTAAGSAFQCTTSTDFQQDALNAIETGSNKKRSEFSEATRHLFSIQG